MSKMWLDAFVRQNTYDNIVDNSYLEFPDRHIVLRNISVSGNKNRSGKWQKCVLCRGGYSSCLRCTFIVKSFLSSLMFCSECESQESMHFVVKKDFPSGGGRSYLKIQTACFFYLSSWKAWFYNIALISLALYKYDIFFVTYHFYRFYEKKSILFLVCLFVWKCVCECVFIRGHFLCWILRNIWSDLMFMRQPFTGQKTCFYR